VVKRADGTVQEHKPADAIMGDVGSKAHYGSEARSGSTASR
jgi:hypothetical protein